MCWILCRIVKYDICKLKVSFSVDLIISMVGRFCYWDI